MIFETPQLTEILDRPIEQLDLGPRSYNCLTNAQIKTIRDLIQQTERRMLRVKNFGPESLTEVKELLTPMGLRFGMHFTKVAPESAPHD